MSLAVSGLFGFWLWHAVKCQVTHAVTTANVVLDFPPVTALEFIRPFPTVRHGLRSIRLVVHACKANVTGGAVAAAAQAAANLNCGHAHQPIQ